MTRVPVDVHVVSHTHWDREWYLTREQYRVRLVGLVDRVLDRLETDPRFTHFHLDGQTIVLEDYLEVRPGETGRLRRHIEAGRLLVGPWYVMPDMHLVSGESLVRNLALGHHIAERFGGVMGAGYMPDCFGHVAQMPQILAGFGLDAAILWRGFAGARAEYWWQAPDGTRALLLHLPREGYCNARRLPPLAPEPMRQAAAALVGREAARSCCGVVLLMAGVDHVEPHPGLVELPLRLQEAGSRARMSTLPDYVAAVRSALASSGATDGLETVSGELRAGEDYAFLLPGVLSARTYLKQANTRIEVCLERAAEPLSAFAWLSGEVYPAGLLEHAWSTLLQNHPHDSICGCSIDAVHEENLVRYASAGQLAEALASQAVAALARRLPAPAAGRLGGLVVNTAAFEPGGVILGDLEVPIESAERGRSLEATLPETPLACFPAADVMAVRDAAGAPLPFQVLGSEERLVHAMSRYQPPLALRARQLRLAAWLPGVPRCGYTSIEIELGAAPGGAPELPPGVAPARLGAGTIENGLVRVSVAPDARLDVTDLRSGRCYRGCLGFESVADVGDEYNFSPAPGDWPVTSAAARRVVVTPGACGPLLASLGVDLELPLPRCTTPDREGRSGETVDMPVHLELAVEAGSPRVVVRIQLENLARDHRLRVLFPTGAQQVARSRADSAFGLVERPARRSTPAAISCESPVSAFPMRSCVAAGDAESGVTVLAEGLHEFEVVDTTAGAAVAVSLLRCVGDLSRGDLTTRRGHAGPALATPGAQCQGRHSFRLAFETWSTPPASASLFAAVASFLAPPRIVAPTGPVSGPDPAPDASLPPRGCFVRIDSAPPNAAVLSALKKADDRESLVVRVFNAEAVKASLELSAARPIRAAYRLDLRERRLEWLGVSKGVLSLTLRPAGIETLELVLGD